MALCAPSNGCSCAITSTTLTISGSGSAGDPWVVDVPEDEEPVEGAGGVRTAFTPALTGSSGDPNLGSTGATYGQYSRQGDLVFYEFVFMFAGTGILTGSGVYTVSKPVAANLLTAAGESARGVVRVTDGSSLDSRDFKAVISALGNELQMRPLNAASYATSALITEATIGTTFPTGTTISGQVVYHGA